MVAGIELWLSDDRVKSAVLLQAVLLDCKPNYVEQVWLSGACSNSVDVGYFRAVSPFTHRSISLYSSFDRSCAFS